MFSFCTSIDMWHEGRRYMHLVFVTQHSLICVLCIRCCPSDVSELRSAECIRAHCTNSSQPQCQPTLKAPRVIQVTLWTTMPKAWSSQPRRAHACTMKHSNIM